MCRDFFIYRNGKKVYTDFVLNDTKMRVKMEKIDIKKRKKFKTMLLENFLFANTTKAVEMVLNDERFCWEQYKKGEIIYDYDNYRNSLGIILKGSVSVKKHRNGNVLINTLKQGDAFGGAVLFSKSERFVASVTACENCSILFISRELMEEIFKISPEANMNYIEYLSDSLVFLNKRLDIFTEGGAEERVLAYLRENCTLDDNGVKTVDNMSMTALAEYVNIGRASLYRVLDGFEDRGVIKRSGRKIYLIKEI